jgi:uncharacterized protein (DUF1810 family)
MPDLQRFLEAQDRDPGGYMQALGEMRAGRKLGHWIWYVFPQLRGLGSSSTSQFYGIDGVTEAEAYVRHDELRRRLLEIAGVVAGQLRAGVPVTTLMGSDIDASKLVSSMTLFGGVASRGVEEAAVAGDLKALSDTARTILDGATQQGYPPCQRTLAMLGASG